MANTSLNHIYLVPSALDSFTSTIYGVIDVHAGPSDLPEESTRSCLSISSSRRLLDDALHSDRSTR